jgi:helix-hairpin-helix protein
MRLRASPIWWAILFFAGRTLLWVSFFNPDSIVGRSECARSISPKFTDGCLFGTSLAEKKRETPFCGFLRIHFYNIALAYVHVYNIVNGVFCFVAKVGASSGACIQMNNQEIARQLVDYAHFLEGRGENLYRIRAYRKAAETLLSLPRSIAKVYEEEGSRGIRKLPGIGSHLSYTIENLVCNGKFQTLDGVEDLYGMTRCLGCS